MPARAQPRERRDGGLAHRRRPRRRAPSRRRAWRVVALKAAERVDGRAPHVWLRMLQARATTSAIRVGGQPRRAPRSRALARRAVAEQRRRSASMAAARSLRRRAAGDCGRAPSIARADDRRLGVRGAAHCERARRLAALPCAASAVDRGQPARPASAREARRAASGSPSASPIAPSAPQRGRRHLVVRRRASAFRSGSASPTRERAERLERRDADVRRAGRARPGASSTRHGAGVPLLAEARAPRSSGPTRRRRASAPTQRGGRGRASSTRAERPRGRRARPRRVGCAARAEQRRQHARVVEERQVLERGAADRFVVVRRAVRDSASTRLR